MKTLNVNVKRQNESYPIHIGQGLLKKLPELVDFTKYSKVLVITDKNVEKYYLTPVLKQIKTTGVSSAGFMYPPGEEWKNLDTVYQALDMLVSTGCDRKSLVLNLGGGVITDMGGLVASLYRRGMDFVNISTTVEGMVDASVGGKVGVNLENYKNYIGVYAQPKAVIIDIDTLDTLDDRNFVAGFAEIIKHGLITDKNYFEFVTSKQPKEFTKDELVKIIEDSCRIKASVVEKDEQESGLRKILNFGHTVGHAVESVSLTTDEKLLHGEAVAIGMVAEAKLSELIGNISEKDMVMIEQGVKKAGLPTRFPQGAEKRDEIIEKMFKDKKNTDGRIKWTLLKNIGDCGWDIEVDKEVWEKALDYILK